VIPDDVQTLLDRRAQARNGKDFAASDDLREQLAALGWGVQDTAAGQVAAPLPAYPVLRELPDRSGEPTTPGCTVALLVEGWPDDVRRCVDALLEHAPLARVVLLDNGVGFEDDRVEVLHLSTPLGFAAARNALIRWDTAQVHVMMDVSTVLEGPITALLDALHEFAAAGWRGVNVDDGWLSFHDAGPGEVEALLGYLVAVRREVALAVPLPPKARFYRNADLEWSFLLREAGYRLVAVDVPARQERHHGYHDSDPAYRDKESKKTYDRFLARFRDRDELRIAQMGDQRGPGTPM
jgi:hypothetical protein